MIERLANEVLEDEYFAALELKAAKNFANQLFTTDLNQAPFEPKELHDLLRFADILSNSKASAARNKAYQLITLTNPLHKSDPYYRTYAHSVLAKLGNFPGIEYLKLKDQNVSELPFDRLIEKETKAYRQTVPQTSGMIFTDSQYELFTRISHAKHLSFSGPTSMGKSFIIKSFIRKVLGNTPPENVVIMVPTRALINQFSIDLNQELRDSLQQHNYTVVTNSNVVELPSEQQHYIFVLTPERLLSYLSQKDSPPIAFLFVDEAHKLAAEKDARAVTAYSAISHALRRNPNLNLYFSSPNVSNPEVFLKLFNKDTSLHYRTSEAPVSQNLFFVDMLAKNVTHYLDVEQYAFAPRIVTEAEHMYEVISRIGMGESNIIYCSSRFDAVDKSEKLYNYIATRQVVSESVKKVVRQIKGYIHKDYYLADFLMKGIAYHFGNLPQIIRTKVESLFKQREIGYVFCTSTLLEGINMPTKNVFILNNKNGRSEFQPIDFWNLAGRAGRLRFELSGNIICLRENEKSWKKPDVLLANRTDIILKPTVESFIDTKLKQIEQVLLENPDIPRESEAMKEILRYVANIISIDTLEIERSNYRSELVQKLIQNNKDQIISLAKEKNGKIDIPSSVLATNNSIRLKIQNEVFLTLVAQKNSPGSIKLPSRVTYDTCKAWLHKFYQLFKWESEEKHFKSEAQLDYFAMLMNQWINGISLNQIINQSITYYSESKRKIATGYSDGGLSYQPFNGKKQHINILIGNIIEDIENVLRFVFEKYFNNYYAMLVEIYGEENAGANWATFLEYGAQNSIVIALQNYGLSRHSADYLYTTFRDCLTIEGDKLRGIDTILLSRRLDKDAIEYDEIRSILL